MLVFLLLTLHFQPSHSDLCSLVALPSPRTQSVVSTGGNGYINDYPMGRFLRDAKLYEIGAGTSEIRRLIIGRSFNAMYKWRGGGRSRKAAAFGLQWMNSVTHTQAPYFVGAVAAVKKISHVVITWSNLLASMPFVTHVQRDVEPSRLLTSNRASSGGAMEWLCECPILGGCSSSNTPPEFEALVLNRSSVRKCSCTAALCSSTHTMSNFTFLFVFVDILPVLWEQS